jgi:hypothetical protein
MGNILSGVMNDVLGGVLNDVLGGVLNDVLDDVLDGEAWHWRKTCSRYGMPAAETESSNRLQGTFLLCHVHVFPHVRICTFWHWHIPHSRI